MAIATLRSTLVGTLFVATALPVPAAIFVCPNGVIQDTPCKVVAVPLPEPARRSCALPPEALQRAVREERQFLTRYADESVHRRAHLADLSTVASRLRSGEARLKELLRNYRENATELAFYENRAVPAELLAKVNANIGQLTALAQIFVNVMDDIALIDGRYRCQRLTFGKLWNNAPPGSSACDRPACNPG